MNLPRDADKLQVFKLHVSEVGKACGESDVEINGQQLESIWDGIEAQGQGLLDVYAGREATWSITCLYDSTPSDGSFSNGDDVVHLLRFNFLHSSEGFTVSYKQHGRPAIVRFSPDVVNSAEAIKTAEKWRQPSLDFDPDIAKNRETEDTPADSTNSLWSNPKNLLSSVTAFQKLLTDKISKIAFCPKSQKQSRPVDPNRLALVPFNPVQNETRSNLESEGTPDDTVTSEDPVVTGALDYIETIEHDELDDAPDNTVTSRAPMSTKANGDITNIHWSELNDKIATPTSGASDSTTTKSESAPAETRGLHHAEDELASEEKVAPGGEIDSNGEFASLTPALDPSRSSPAPHNHLNYRPLKVFGLILVIFSLLVWCILRWKDPRWRVDRAARREERRNRRLYKRAARKHMINTWIWNFRLKFNLVSNETLSWDEKRARVSGQEEILENVMKQDIRALRNAHRVVSNITAAEEGHHEFGYEADGSERRRSVATLPGYESEGSQPPSYEASRSFESTTLVGSSTFARADIDSNPDSSVVSTSPRISRDGTNSDFDEKIEVLSLESNPANITHQVYKRV